MEVTYGWKVKAKLETDPERYYYLSFYKQPCFSGPKSKDAYIYPSKEVAKAALKERDRVYNTSNIRGKAVFVKVKLCK